MTNVALIGAGGVAQRHAKVLSGLDDVQVVAVADVSEDAAKALASEYGAAAYADPETALDESKPDAVYVCVPPFAHGAAERAVLARALPMFVEKPVGIGLEDAEAIAELVEKAGVVTGTGYHWRTLDTVQQARELLASTTPLLAHGYWLDKRPPVPWWGHRDKSGGQVIEQVAHVLDLSRYLLGDPASLTAAGIQTDDVPDSDIDDATAALVRFADGPVGTFDATCALRAKHSTGLTIVAPGMHLQIGEESLIVDSGDGPQTFTPSVDPREQVDADFIAAVRGELDQTRAPYSEAVASQRFAVAISQAAQSGQPVELATLAGSAR
ncbi:Gfo/Idh/MocA family oxidoreductase [Epidermidibacterium keratini]|uniref:Gfo/Idh/MocA family oxidoreductase n=1 Tax=Epidermidibacterium keratini TaxID=1891644 RepID=A0A7L4YNB0_9ACTN|nr:Gfo/Idh/MocA family oxidoreductase [Epidermidibacterium keratini]QHC00037.1 Gfo/Idh/MocA family oxidoreductase [Epidermidibacterium keratini]